MVAAALFFSYTFVEATEESHHHTDVVVNPQGGDDAK